MNAGSVQAAPAAGLGQLGKMAGSTNGAGGIFGSVLAGMTQTAATPAAVSKGKPAEDLTAVTAQLLSADDAAELADSLESIIQVPAEQLLAGFDKLNASSKASEWADLLDIEYQDVVETLIPLLEDAGVSKEQLSEIAYSDDVWPLLTTLAQKVPGLSNQLEDLFTNPDGQTAGRQAMQTAAFLKTLNAVLPIKDLMGWQEDGLVQLNEIFHQLTDKVAQALQSKTASQPAEESLKTFLAVSRLSGQNTKLQPGNSADKPAADYKDLIPASRLGSAIDQVMTQPKGSSAPDQPAVDPTLQKSQAAAFMTAAHTNSGGQDSEGNKEQNTSSLIQNQTIQPIVSKTVFSLETPEAKPSSQSEALLQKLQGLFKQTNFGQLGGTNRLLVKLYPEHLGTVRIELLQTNGVMTARILASTALGKEMLDSQLHHLRQSFSQQNIQVDRIDITQAVQDPSRNDRSQQFSQQQFKGEQDQPEQREPESDETQASFQEFLIDLEG